MPPRSLRSRATRETAAKTATAAGRDGATADLVLTGHSPGRLCAYWTMPPLAGRDARPALALYRVDPRVPEPRGMLIFVEEGDGLRRVEARDGTFIAELGIVHADGRWIRLAASEPASVPAAGESAACDVRMVDIRTPPPGLDSLRTEEATPFLDRFRRNRHRRSDRIHVWTDDGTPSDETDIRLAGPDAREEIRFPSGGDGRNDAAGWPEALRPTARTLPAKRSA